MLHAVWASPVLLLKQALATSLPLVLDADGLNWLAEWQGTALAQRGHWVLTPHPGEAARLLNTMSAEIALDRFAAARTLQATYGGAVVLKGAGSLIAGADGDTWVCHAGNPGMATGGMGDVLSGVIGGLLAQGLNLSHAAAAGVTVHAAAGERATEQAGQRGLLATDLMPYIRRLVNPH